MQAIQVPAQALARLEELHGDHLQTQQHQSGEVDQRQHPGMAPHGETPLGEGQYEVQEQGRLQQPRDFVAPIDVPVELVEFSGVVEAVEDEGNEAENVEVSRSGCSPPPEKDVKP